MMEVLALLVTIALLVMVFNLRKRVSDLERSQKGGLQQAPAPQTPQSVPVQAPLAVPNVQLISPVGAVAQSGPSVDARLIEWFKENWLLKLGALLLLIGFGWLVSYAFLNNWIGPMGRITLGLAGGALILLLGTWRIRSYVTQGSIFVALGATVVLLTTYAARTVYDFFTPTSALALMFGTSAFVAFVSGIYNRKQLAVASVALAATAPILAHSPTQDYVGLFAYLLVVVLGAVWIVAWKGFREAGTMALVVVALYSMPLLVGLERSDMSTLLLFAYGFGAIFYITNTAGLLRLKGSDAMPDLVTAAGNALLLAAWIYVAAPKDFQSLILAAWATAFIVGAFAVFRVSGQQAPLFLYAAIGVGYIAAATAIELSGAALTIAYTLEATAVAVALFGITRNVAAAQRSTLLLIGPAVLSFGSVVSSDWQFGVFNQHFFVLAALAVTFLGLGGIFFQSAHATGVEDVKTGNGALLVAGSLYAYILLWLSLHAALPESPDMAVMAALFVYTVIGIGAYVWGTTAASKGLQAYGGTLLVFVVGRLLVVDVWQMELTGRIITFFLIGTLLMSTAFLGRTKKTETPAPPAAT
ncbi:MAG: DUF2339 domain-containing protein [bacterium]|nr:DUF2339 domain-containing protein [bacterium]